MFFPFIFLMLENDEDRLFLEGIYLEYHRLLYAQALQITHSEVAAQDVVSDSLMALMKKINLLRTLPCNKLRAYLVTTVRHTAINLFNRQKRERLADDVTLEELAGGGSGVDEALLSRAGVEAIKEAIKALPEREKEVMLMRYFRELSDEEIAAETGLRPVSVRVHLSRARKHLQGLLAQREGYSETGR